MMRRERGMLCARAPGPPPSTRPQRISMLLPAAAFARKLHFSVIKKKNCCIVIARCAPGKVADVPGVEEGRPGADGAMRGAYGECGVHGTSSSPEDPSQGRSEYPAAEPARTRPDAGDGGMASDSDIEPATLHEHGSVQLEMDSALVQSTRSLTSQPSIRSQLSQPSARELQDTVGELQPRGRTIFKKRSNSHLSEKLKDSSLTEQCSAIIHSFVTSGIDGQWEDSANLDATTAPGLSQQKASSPGTQAGPAVRMACLSQTMSKMSKLLRQVSHRTLSPGLFHGLSAADCTPETIHSSAALLP